MFVGLEPPMSIYLAVQTHYFQWKNSVGLKITREVWLAVNWVPSTFPIPRQWRICISKWRLWFSVFPPFVGISFQIGFNHTDAVEVPALAFLHIVYYRMCSQRWYYQKWWTGSSFISISVPASSTKVSFSYQIPKDKNGCMELLECSLSSLSTDLSVLTARLRFLLIIFLGICVCFLSNCIPWHAQSDCSWFVLNSSTSIM